MEEPESRFTESLRAIKVSFDLARISRSVGSKSGNSGNVIAFTSTLPQEGKSTAAANFARHLAHAGNRVIMIDADFRHPALSNQLTNKPRLGLLQVLAGQCHLGDAICVDPLTGLVFLPVGPNELALSRANSLLGSAKMKQFVEAIRAAYDCVVVDLPPLAPIVDVQTTAAFVDFYVYIVEWGRTKIDVVAHHLNRAANVHDRLLGVVLNKANVKQLDRYESYYGLSQYNATFKSAWIIPDVVALTCQSRSQRYRTGIAVLLLSVFGWCFRGKYIRIGKRWDARRSEQWHRQTAS